MNEKPETTMIFAPGARGRRSQLRFSERRLLLMIGDVLAVMLAVFLSLVIWAGVAGREFTPEFVLPQVYWFPVLVVLWLLLANANDLYDLNVASSRVRSVQALLVITLQLLVIYLLVFFFSPRDTLPRLFILYYGVLSFLLIAVWRVLNPALIGWASTPRRALVIGTDASAETIVETINHYGEDAYEVRGIIGAPEAVGSRIGGVPVVGTWEDLLNFVNRDRISELVITHIPQHGEDVFRNLMRAYEYGVALVPMPLLYERITGRIPVQHVEDNWAVVLPIDAKASFDLYPALQRTMDIVLGLIGLVAYIMLLPLIALVIKLDSRGPIFYSQTRVGLNGRPFMLTKFRTMVQDAESNTGAVFSQAGDPRITRVGRIMRKTRLDELPQLLSVLRGEMSIVGPRPERPEHVTRLTESIPFYRTRLVVRPGLTGWAQVRYAYGSNDHDALVKLEYDLYYIRNRSLLLDVEILIRTVGKVLRMSGM